MGGGGIICLISSRTICTVFRFEWVTVEEWKALCAAASATSRADERTDDGLCSAVQSPLNLSRALLFTPTTSLMSLFVATFSRNRRITTTTVAVYDCGKLFFFGKFFRPCCTQAPFIIIISFSSWTDRRAALYSILDAVRSGFRMK